MRNHANLVLKLYAEARGQASRHFGSSFRASDVLMARLGVWERAQEWVQLQSPGFRLLLEQFVQGVNDYANEHPGTIDSDKQDILPVSVDDVIAHYQRVFHITMMVDFEGLVSGLMNTKLQGDGGGARGSNAWALSASKTQEGYPILMSSPHLPWTDMFRLFELHLSSPELNLYGVAPVGLPVLTMAFNDHLGWTHTVNKFQGWTVYELDLKPGGYLFNNEVIPFNVSTKHLHEETITVRSSIHGPVIWAANGKAYALRIAGLDNPKGLEQWWKMACSHNLHEFQAALEQMQVPTLNVVYSDREGHIMYFFNGQIPVDSSLWTQTYSYQELPKCIDPPSGWIQNTNDPPWTCTSPAMLHASDFPSSISAKDAPLSLRSQQSLQFLDQNKKLSFDEVVQGRASRRVRLADLMLDELLDTIAKSEQKEAQEAAGVLKAWDRTIDFSSRGSVLFAYWVYLMDQQGPGQAVSTLINAAAFIRASFGALDVPWADVFLLAEENVGNGRSALFSEDMLGVLSELWYVPAADGRFKSVGGECFAFVAQFSQPVRASAILLYGNKTTGGRQDQFDLYKEKKMRPVLRTRDELEGQVADHECFYMKTEAYEQDIRI